MLTQHDYPVVEANVRRLLARCAYQNPPLRISAVHGPGRIYRVGEFTFVLNADSTHLITVLTGAQSGTRKGQRRNQRYRQARRAHRVAVAQ